MVCEVVETSEAPLAPIKGKDTYVYWGICGLQQPIRYALALGKAEYVEVRLETGVPGTPEYKKQWFAIKPALEKAGCAFPNLPYAIFADGSFLSQSSALLRKVGKTYGLEAPDADAMNLALDEAADLDGVVTGGCYRDFAGLKLFVDDKLPAILARWAAFIGDKPFVAGDSVSIADCKVYEIFRKIQVVAAHHGVPDVLAQAPAIAAYVKRFEAIPAISDYLHSSLFLPRPLNNPHAQFT